MRDRIRYHVDSLFEGAPRTRRAMELRDELEANLCDRYDDLIKRGHDEDSALKIAIEGIGDFDELIGGLRETERYDPESEQMQRQKSAIIVSISVAIYIISLIFPLVFEWMGRFGETLGMVLMIICWAGATMLLIYNGMTKPKHIKKDDSLVEEFKAWSSRKEDKKALVKQLSSIVWSSAAMLYLIIGIFFDAWHPGWLIFPLAAVVNNVLVMLLGFKGDGR
jgi:hypothetical protein